MRALYRVPESPNVNTAVDQETLQVLWKITLHNFPPDDWDTLDIDEVVVMTTPSSRGRGFPSPVALPNFVHPSRAIYVIGSDSRDLQTTDIPSHLQQLRTHHVFVPTNSQHSMWGHVVWALLCWDRRMKNLPA